MKVKEAMRILWKEKGAGKAFADFGSLFADLVSGNEYSDADIVPGQEWNWMKFMRASMKGKEFTPAEWAVQAKRMTRPKLN